MDGILKAPLVKIGLSVLIMVVGSAAFAMDDGGEEIGANGRPIELNKTSAIGPATVVQHDVLREREVSREFERSMSGQDPRSGLFMLCRRPGCGPWKNAINHMNCTSGYDVY